MGFLSHSDIQEKVKHIQLSLRALIKARESDTSLNKLSTLIGRNPGYLNKRLKQSDQPVSLLLLLSQHLQTNLLEPYIDLLPANIQATRREQALQQQITDLQKQLADAQKERDFYKEVAMK